MKLKDYPTIVEALEIIADDNGMALVQDADISANESTLRTAEIFLLMIKNRTVEDVVSGWVVNTRHVPDWIAYKGEDALESFCIGDSIVQGIITAEHITNGAWIASDFLNQCFDGKYRKQVFCYGR